jgi:pimeloyl-ACP methyl ester carboxylesterase
MSATARFRDYAETALAAYAVGLEIGPDAPNTVQLQAEGRGMSSSQAASFNARWTVLAQSDLTSWNLVGFSAVLLENAAGQKVLAIRGTDGPADWITDLVNVGVFGSPLGMPQYNALAAFYQQLVSTGKLTASDTLVVTGHSLGGFLAQAFTALNPNVVSATYTYNAPGIAGATTLGVRSPLSPKLTP